MTLENRQNPDGVTIIGAGIVGVCCALSLQERGYSVRIIDRANPGEATSFGNAGVISPWSCVPQCLPGTWKKVPGWLLDKDGPVSFKFHELPVLLPWLRKFLANCNPDKVDLIADMMDRLMSNTIPAYRRHLNGTGHENLLADSKYVNVFRGSDQPDLTDPAWKLRTDRGAPVYIIGRRELLEMEPALSGDCHSAIIIDGQARAVQPGDLCKALAAKVVANGGEFVRADVKSVETNPDGTLTLHADGSAHQCSKLVLASGIGSTDLLGASGVMLPLISERGYHVEFADPGVVLNNSIMDVGGKFVVSSMSGGIRAAGTTEFAAASSPPDHARSRSLERLTKSLLPGFNTGAPSYWMGVRPSFPDSLPAIGLIPGYDNLFAAFGHSHYGMGMAPATGELIAEFVSGKPQNSGFDAIRPDRNF